MIQNAASMNMPSWSPPLRGRLLRVVAWLVSFDLFRDMLLRQVRKGSHISSLPEVR
jgi:hypothetical protein